MGAAAAALDGPYEESPSQPASLGGRRREGGRGEVVAMGGCSNPPVRRHVLDIERQNIE